MYQDISPEHLKDNSVPVGFAAVIPEVIRQIQAAEAAKQSPMPCTWLRNVNTDPPDGMESGELAALPTSQIDQIEDSSEPIIDPPKNRKLPLSENGTAAQSSGKKKSVWPPLPPELIDALADGVIEVLPAMQQRLLDEGVIVEPVSPGLEPVVLPEEAQPADTIPCKVQLRLAWSAEPKAAPSSAYFDGDPTGRFCRLLRISLNASNPAMRTCVEKRNIDGVRFFAAAALVRTLTRDPSPLAQTLLAEVKTRVGIAPNSPLSTTTFARAVARIGLLDSIKDIFGQAFENAIGRSFALAEIDVRIPVKALGPPWDRN
jgi:hypothetical protein